MRLPESARAVLLIGHAATVWRVHMSRMMRMRSMHGKRCLNHSVRSAPPIHCNPSLNPSLNHGISIALHHSPSHSITLHGNQSHSITLLRNPSQSMAAAGAPFEHAAWLEIQLAAGFEQVLGWLCARERGTWGCADADCQEDGALELLRRRRGLHRGKQSVSDAGS